MTAYVYRHFDEFGRLLYVGLAKRPERRLVAHGSTSIWHSLVASSTYERFSNREGAALAEVEAISNENPAWNVAHNHKRANPALHPVRIPKLSTQPIVVLAPSEPCHPWRGMLISLRSGGPANHVEVKQPNDGRGQYFDYHAVVAWMEWFGYFFIDGYIKSVDGVVRLDWIDAINTIGTEWRDEYIHRSKIGLEVDPLPFSQ